MAFTIKNGIELLINGDSLSRQQSQDVMEDIMSGKANDHQISAYLTALRIRGETPEIITGAAMIMRKFASSICPEHDGSLVDTCGTGGDHSNTFNISTISAIVSAGAGVKIAKHGNRSVSSSCGSADLFEGFGVNINLTPKEVEKIISDVGIGFMFAPKFHPAMKYAMPARRGLKMRTLFNVLGPLTNPANANAAVLGVFEKDLVEVLANVMNELGSKHVYVVHSEPGVDEIIPLSKVYIGEVKEGQVKTYTLEPKDFGIDPIEMKEIEGGTLEENLKIAADIITNRDTGIRRKVVVLNSAYAIMAAGLGDSLEKAIEIAEDSISNRNALEKLEKLVKTSGGSLEKFSKIIRG
jgi:anthranilate phosphoribosyltransferase